MHEVTHISYGEGTVSIALDSTSLTEVNSPNFRFGDYKSVVSSFFTPKELIRIENGESADLTFNFVVSDQPEDESFLEQLHSTINEKETEVGSLHEGLHIDISASKSIANESAQKIDSVADRIELQMDIPLYLVKEDRSYYYLESNMGDYEFISDFDEESNVLTLNTHAIGHGVLLYQDSLESLVEKKDPFINLKSEYLFLGGIVVLAGIWFFLERLRQNNA